MEYNDLERLTNDLSFKLPNRGALIVVFNSKILSILLFFCELLCLNYKIAAANLARVSTLLPNAQAGRHFSQSAAGSEYKLTEWLTFEIRAIQFHVQDGG